MEQKIMEVLYRMQPILEKDQLKNLQDTLNVVFSGCNLVKEKQELQTINRNWLSDMEEYLMSKALEGKSPATVHRYRYELQRLLSYVNKEVKNIRPDDISGYMRAYKRIRQVSNQTLKNVRAVYSSFFAWLRDRDRIGKNPMLLVEEIKVEVKIRKPYTDAERELLFRQCTSLRDKALIECFYSTAVRVSELASLDQTDIRFGIRDLTVFGKGGKERTAYLNEKSHMYLQEYLLSRQDNNPALFVSEKAPHQRLTKSGIEDIIRRIGKRANIHAYPHRFRRTAATNALNRGMPVQEVSKLLGHSKLETTMMYCTIEQESVQFHHKKYLSA